MFGPEFKARCWRPVFDEEGHTLDVFSKRELGPVGGGGGLVKTLNDKKIIASIDEVHAGLTVGPDDIVIQHNIGEAHEVYKQLGLQREPMIIPS